MLQLFYSAAEIITPAAEQTTSAPPSLFITIVASAFGGALITSGVTIWAKFAESKAEHRKWLHQEKLKAYSQFADLGYRILNDISKGQLDEARLMMTDQLFVVAQIRLVAPSQISLGALSYREAVNVMFDSAKNDPDNLNASRGNAINVLDSLMQKMKIDLSIALHKRSLGEK